MQYKIKPIHMATYKNFEKSRFSYGKDFGIKFDVPCIAWLVYGGGRGPILVDTGPPLDAAHALKHYIEMEVLDNSLELGIREAGFDPAEVKDVIITHLHWDHCYNLGLFPNANIWCQETEIKYAVTPIQIHKIVYETCYPDIRPAWMDFMNQICLVDGDVPFTDGIELYSMPGHSLGCQGVLVNTAEGRLLIASDTFPLYECYDEGIPNGIHLNLADWFSSYKKARKVCDKVLPGHDMKVLQRAVYG